MIHAKITADIWGNILMLDSSSRCNCTIVVPVVVHFSIAKIQMFTNFNEEDFLRIYIIKKLLIYYLLAAIISHAFIIYRANMYLFYLDNKTPVMKDVLICNYLPTYLDRHLPV